jgi:hypothetical protein
MAGTKTIFKLAWILACFLGWYSNEPYELRAAEGKGEKLTAPQLFPEKTLAYVRVDDMRQLRSAYEKSSYGRLSNDEQLKPILGDFYGGLIKATEEMTGVVGLNLDEFLSIPSGELAFALLSPGKKAKPAQVRNEEGELQDLPLVPPVVAMMIDAGDEIASIQVMLQRMGADAGQEAEHLQKDVSGLILHSYQSKADESQQFSYFIDQGVFIACTSMDYIQDLAQIWLGEAGQRKTLADNQRFLTIMKRCVGTEGERPQISFYADPMALLRGITPASPQSAMMLAMLPPLGLDGLEAIGGSWIVAPADFDSIGHIHVLMSSPRRAILDLVRPKEGDVQPEDWVPESVSGYMTINWDLQSTLKGIQQMFNQFRGSNAWQNEVFGPAADQLGFDIQEEIFDQLEGRISIMQGYVRPVTANSQSTVWGIRFKNIKQFESDILPKLMEQAQQRGQVTSEEIGKLTVQVLIPSQSNRPENVVVPLRDQETCVTVIDDYLVVSDSRYMMQQVADVLEDPDLRLNQSLEFQLIHDRITEQLQGKNASAVTFDRPEQALQQFYEMVRDPENRAKFREQSKNTPRRDRPTGNARMDELRQRFAGSNPVLTALEQAMEKHELPPFAEISKYMAPSGGYLVEEDSGLHYTTFTLRRD